MLTLDDLGGNKIADLIVEFHPMWTARVCF